jgi:hypothetical protein
VALQWSDRLINTFGLDCQNCPREKNCEKWDVSGVEYKHEGRNLLGRTWERCPSAYLCDPHLSLAVEMYASTKISPLADWPDSWSCWVRDYLVKIDQAINERRSFDAER